MKKLIYLSLLVFVLVLSACTKDEQKTTNNEETTTTEQQVMVNISVTNPNETVINFDTLNVTKGQLYDALTSSIGGYYVINIIDREVLSTYEDQIDVEELNDEIAADMKSQGEDAFYRSMIQHGIISSLDDEDKDAKIRENYLLGFIHKAYATEQKDSEDEVTSEFIQQQVVALHDSIDLKIYDTDIARQYQEIFDENFQPEQNALPIEDGEHIVASYKVDGTVKYIYADDLYNVLKVRYGMLFLLDKLNNESLKQIQEIQLSDTESQSILDQIASYKTQYQSTPNDFTWEEFLTLYYGVFNEAQLYDVLISSTLKQNYILGTDSYEGVNPITETDILDAYNNWFSINASHIYFTFDASDETSQNEALKKAQQVIDGCTQEEIDTDTCYIYFDINDASNTETTVPFTGLKTLGEADYYTVFKALAKKYSDDPSAEQNSGNLGYFGPKQMVQSFEDGAKTVANAIKEGALPFTLTPILSELEREDETIHGYHVIYVAGEQERPVEPSLYDQYIADLDNENVNVNERYTDEQLAELNEYDTFITNLITTLKNEHLALTNQYKLLAQLRQTYEIEFLDTEVQNVYQNLTNFDLGN